MANYTSSHTGSVIDNVVSNALLKTEAASYYCTLSTAQTISGQKTFTGNLLIGSGGAGGLLNGAATNGGIDSIKIGDDIWLGDCNQGGIMGMKSTGTNCGFWFYNSGGTNTAQLYYNGTGIFSNVCYTTNIVHGGTWISGTKNASYRVTNCTTASSGSYYQGWFSGKTPSGAWSLGALSGNNDLYFVYGSDTNFNAGTNSTVNARITAAGAFTNASKREYKENIQEIKYSCLDIINSINICSFNMKGDPEKDYRVGFIADDTNPVVSGKKQDCMDLQNCIGVLIKAVQELSNKIDNLEASIKNKK